MNQCTQQQHCVLSYVQEGQRAYFWVIRFLAERPCRDPEDVRERGRCSAFSYPNLHTVGRSQARCSRFCHRLYVCADMSVITMQADDRLKQTSAMKAGASAVNDLVADLNYRAGVHYILSGAVRDARACALV